MGWGNLTDWAAHIEPQRWHPVTTPIEARRILDKVPLDHFFKLMKDSTFGPLMQSLDTISDSACLIGDLEPPADRAVKAAEAHFSKVGDICKSALDSRTTTELNPEIRSFITLVDDVLRTRLKQVSEPSPWAERVKEFIPDQKGPTASHAEAARAPDAGTRYR